MDLRNSTPMHEELPPIPNTTEESVPHCEKADLEIHEKETDNPVPSSSSM